MSRSYTASPPCTSIGVLWDYFALHVLGTEFKGLILLYVLSAVWMLFSMLTGNETDLTVKARQREQMRIEEMLARIPGYFTILYQVVMFNNVELNYLEPCTFMNGVLDVLLAVDFIEFGKARLADP
jgi:hypothetical protein